jgi:hypothetical protein
MRYLLVCIFCFSLFACKKQVVDDSPIESNWLLPLVKGNLSLNDLTKLEGKSFQYQITPDDIGMPANLMVSSPNLEIDFIGPFAIPTQEIIKYLKVDSIEVSMKIQNLFPVNFNSGFTITMRSSKDTATTNNILFSTTFSNALQTNGKDSISLNINNVTINDSIYFFIEHLQIDAFNNVIFNENIPIEFTINKVRLNEIALFSNQSIELSDTVVFDAGNLSSIYDSGNSAISDSSISGYFNFYTDNAMPIFSKMQMVFMKDAERKDSVFENSFILDGAVVDGAGNPTNVVSKKNVVNIRKSKLKNIEKSNKIIYSFSINTNGYMVPYVVISKNNLLGLQIVSDLKLILNPFKF